MSTQKNYLVTGANRGLGLEFTKQILQAGHNVYAACRNISDIEDLDLLFAELVKHFEIKVEKNQIDDFIEEESKRYKDPDQYKKWITGQPQQLEQFRMIVLEEQLVEKLQNVLKSKKKVIKFSELANR